MHVFICLCVEMFIYIYGCQRLISNVFLNLSSVNLKLASPIRLGGKWVPGICWSDPQHWSYNMHCFYMVLGIQTKPHLLLGQALYWVTPSSSFWRHIDIFNNFEHRISRARTHTHTHALSLEVQRTLNQSSPFLNTFQKEAQLKNYFSRAICLRSKLRKLSKQTYNNYKGKQENDYFGSYLCVEMIWED